MEFQGYLRQHAGLPPQKKKLIPVAWGFVIFWFLFGIGPGAVIGNAVFGNPGDSSTWIFGIPSIWAWQIIWCAIGVFLMWFLAYKMELSTVPKQEIIPLREDIGDAQS